jgi:hypothetical protein
MGMVRSSTRISSTFGIWFGRGVGGAGFYRVLWMGVSAVFPKAKFVSRRLLVFHLPKPALPRLPASTAAAPSVRQIVQPMTAAFITPMSICIAW